MESVKNCRDCRLGFKRVGFLSVNERIREHEEMFYIQSNLNPADLGTKFDRFQNVYKEIGDDSLFRKGPACLEFGVEEAVRRKQLIPIDKIMPSQREKESAALEMIKLHQLVLTKNRGERLKYQ